MLKGEVRDGTVVAGNPARVVKTTDEHLRALEASPHRLDVWHLDAAERERRIKAHFGIDTPAASDASGSDRDEARRRG